MHQRAMSIGRIALYIWIAASLAGAFIEYRPSPSRVVWLSLEAAQEKAQRENKYIYLDVYAAWCAPCRQMDKLVFTNDSVRMMLNTRLVPARVNIDDTTGGRVRSRFNIQALPTSLILYPDGIEAKRVVGFQDASSFLQWLEDTSFSVFSSWQVFDSARETAQRTNRPILVLLLRTRADLDQVRRVFGGGKIQDLIRSRYVPSLLLYESETDRRILDTLRTQLPETAGAGLLIFHGDGSLQRHIWLTTPAVSEDFLLRQLGDGSSS